MDLLQKLVLPAGENAQTWRQALGLASEYALTPDNLLKMGLIHLRIKAGVPVVIMGETGCGKTSLIRALARACHVQGDRFRVMSFHAGVTEYEVAACVRDSIELAAQCAPGEQVWVFLDEINTSEHMGFVADVVCHRRFQGIDLPPSVVFMARTLNPKP